MKKLIRTVFSVFFFIMMLPLYILVWPAFLVVWINDYAFDGEMSPAMYFFGALGLTGIWFVFVAYLLAH